MCLRNNLSTISSLALLNMYRNEWSFLIAMLFLLKCVSFIIAIDAKIMNKIILFLQIHFFVNLCEWIFLDSLSRSLLWNVWVIDFVNTRRFSAVSCALYFIIITLIVDVLLEESLHSKHAIVQQIFFLHIIAQFIIHTTLLNLCERKTTHDRRLNDDISTRSFITFTFKRQRSSDFNDVKLLYAQSLFEIVREKKTIDINSIVNKYCVNEEINRFFNEFLNILCDWHVDLIW